MIDWTSLKLAKAILKNQSLSFLPFPALPSIRFKHTLLEALKS